MVELGKAGNLGSQRKGRGGIRLCLFFFITCVVFCALLSDANIIAVAFFDGGQNEGIEAYSNARFAVSNSGNKYLEPDDIFDDDGVFDAQYVQKGHGAIVIEQSSRRILYAENKDTKLFPASTTKVLTALVVIEQLPLDKEVKIPKQAVGIEGSSIYLREGETLTVKELLLGLMLRSGNDSAVALALAVSPTVEEFASLMNETAKRLGAVNSNFVNPHGLHNDNHYTTAYDLAIICAEGFSHKAFRDIVATKSAVISGAEAKRYIQNKNKILWQYEGGNGVKTGYTKMSGRCLVASALRENMQVISVVLNHGAMWEDSHRNMDYAFATYKMAPLYENLTHSVDITNGKAKSFTAKAQDCIHFPIKKDGSEKFEVEFSLKKKSAPVKIGDECGEVKVTFSNRLLFTGKVFSIENIEKKTLRDKFDEFFKRKKQPTENNIKTILNFL